MSENIDDLKEEIAKRDRSSRILKAEIENLKKALSDKSHETLANRITFLEIQLNEKDKELTDLKSANVSSTAGGSAESQDLKTKLIILQSKIRKNTQDYEALKTKAEDLEMQNTRLKKQTEGAQSQESINEEIDNYKKQIAQLKAQISDMSQYSEKARELEQENAKLKRDLSTKSSIGSAEMGEFQNAGDQAIVNKLKSIIEERDQIIKNLQEQGASSNTGGAGGTFMSENRIKRRVTELESQVAMMKKNEGELKKRYEDAMKKLSAREEFSDY
jgi:DNA repair exonuclease SbcCD ATPase subunit